MQRVIGLSLVMTIALAAAPRPAPAQYLPEEIAQRPAHEGPGPPGIGIAYQVLVSSVTN